MSPPSKELMHFNPRSPHGERRAADDQRVAAVGISTHAPRTGSDIVGNAEEVGNFSFQPTLPARGATGVSIGSLAMQLISPHAPRTGSDMVISVLLISASNISTHAPRTGSDALVNKYGGNK